MEASKITKILDMLNNSNYQKILIDGKWGIGKTKYALDYCKGKSNIKLVSLFGKRNIDDILKDIYFSLLDDLEKPKAKKFIMKHLYNMKKLDINISAISISVPLVKSLIKHIESELQNQDFYIIIFDDLERKHQDLDIKELFGLIESISINENIKSVLITSLKNLDESSKLIFDDYKEKSIDKIFHIENYDKSAPAVILGDKWEVLHSLVEELELVNLRTLTKFNNFYVEVLNSIGNKKFNDKFSESDLIRMCFGVVYFDLELKRLKKYSKDIDDTAKIFYETGSFSTARYISRFILKNSFYNDNSLRILKELDSWFLSGEDSSNDISNIIELISKKNMNNFYSDESEILELIKASKYKLQNITKNDSLLSMIININVALSWCDTLKEPYGLENEEIVNKLEPLISEYLNLRKQLYEQKFDLSDFDFVGTDFKELINTLNERIKEKYFDDILYSIDNNYKSENYVDYRQLNDLGKSLDELDDIENLVTIIKKNNYFFPIPSGKLYDEKWNWCHSINRLIKSIEVKDNKQNINKEFINFLLELKDKSDDKMLNHRINQLIAKK